MKRSSSVKNGSDVSEKQSVVKYTIKTQTSVAYKDATANPAQVCIQLLGNKTATPWLELDDFENLTFVRGHEDTFELKTSSVGVPYLIKLKLTGDYSQASWACDWVSVQMEGKSNAVMFPLYDWVDEETTVAPGDATVVNEVDNPVVAEERKLEIETSRKIFDWIPKATKNDIGWELPRYVNEKSAKQLPVLFQMDEIRHKNFKSNQATAASNLILQGLKSFVFPLNSFSRFKDLYTHLHRDSPMPTYLYKWQSDEEFGRQQMSGISPLSFKVCRSLPKCCLITDDDVRWQLNGPLKEEMKNGKVFIGDYSEAFKGVVRNRHQNKELVCPEAICLYYVDSSQNLIPIAIQLVPNDVTSIFTPHDSEDDWLLAKMYFKVAMGNCHEWGYHFLHTHDVMEPVAVALFRNLPRAHPLYKLLRPHLQTVSAINAEARTDLIPKGSKANGALATQGVSMSRKSFQSFEWEDLNIPQVIKKRGLDSKYLTKFPYRDDAIRLWGLQEEFVTKILSIFYQCDEDVQNDEELQEMMRDMAVEGFGWQDGNTHGVPTCILTKSELVSFVTTTMFISSCQHAAVNFPQYEYYKFVPNAPLAMRLNVHKKGEGSMERILNSLPDVQMSAFAIALGYSLSAFSPNEVYLGNYPMGLFTDQEVLDAEREYREKLAQVSQEIKERNKHGRKYTALLPEYVPNSIAI